mgnify:CR=1 FL=1
MNSGLDILVIIVGHDKVYYQLNPINISYKEKAIELLKDNNKYVKFKDMIPKDEVIEMERDSLELDNIHCTIVTRKIHNTDYSTIFAVDNIGRTLSCSMVYAPLYERIMSKDIMNLIFGENARYTYTTI